MGKPMLYGGCCHHVYERHVHLADDAVCCITNQNNENLQMWEEDEGDAYKNQGAEGSETWWSYQSCEIGKRLLFSTQQCHGCKKTTEKLTSC